MAETPFQAYQRNISDVIVAYFDDLRLASGNDELVHWLVESLFDLAMGFPDVHGDKTFTEAWDGAIDRHGVNQTELDMEHRQLLARVLIEKGIIARPGLDVFKAGP